MMIYPTKGKNKPFETVLKTRKSTRRFSKKPVPLSMVYKVIELGRYAPTPCNQQLWDLVIVTDKRTKERLVNEAASSTIIQKAPVVIVITYDGWNYKEAIQSASMAVQNMHLAANFFGLGALAMNSYGSDTKIKSILNIPEGHVINCFFLLGYIEEQEKDEPLVPRRPLQEIIHLKRFGKKNIPPHTYNPELWDIDDLSEYQKYYCRKTFLGKPMDIISGPEEDLVKKSLLTIKDPVIDVFSYDGMYLSLFPTSKITTYDFNEVTAFYSRKTVGLRNQSIKLNQKIYNPELKSLGKAKTITSIYKIERLPTILRKRVFKQAYKSLDKRGTFLIISRKNNLFYNLFYNMIRIKFGDDIRKTGIYAFFGPYKPLSIKNTKKELKEAGFRIVNSKQYFILPAFFEQAYQMYLQFKKSGGSTFLHRKRQKNIITRILEGLIKLQGLRPCLHGSVMVIKARK